MPWGLQVSQVPTSIGAIYIRLLSTEGTITYRYNVAILDQNGEEMEHVIGNLAEIVSAGRVNQALGILTDVRQKAESDLLP